MSEPTTKRTLKKTVVVEEKLEFPDYFSEDDTPRGRAVDVYLGVRAPGRHKGPRAQLWEDDHAAVTRAIQVLTEAYTRVDAIIAALGPQR